MIRNHIAQQKAVSNYSVVTPFIIGIFIAIIFANIALTKVYDRVGVNMDLDSYEKYLELDKYGENKYIDHFPEKIPDFADKAEIREWTGIVPRELGFYLYYKIDENNIPNLELDSYKEKSKEVINTVSKLEDVRQVVVIPDRVIESLKIEDGKDFTIFLLDGSPITEVTSGYSYGVGINYTDKRVLFFTERW